MLSVGGTQVEYNYRLRVISNSSTINDDDILDNGSRNSAADNTAVDSSAYHIETGRNRVTVNNLEIRRLQVSDSGWYECQLPTKPTQINYIHLEVLGKRPTNQLTNYNLYSKDFDRII